jgi:hypothetical protein
MRIIEREWKYGKVLAYAEVEEELIPTTKGTRVLPAPFFYDKKQYYELWARYEPGEKKTFPNGGYEVADMVGGIRSYELDQIIIHPAVTKHKKLIEKLTKQSEKREKQREQTVKKILKEQKTTTGKRGRPALDPVEKERRAALKVSNGEKSGGKRGRPRSVGNSTPTEPKVKGTGKRGRPPLSAEAIAAKELAKAQLLQRSGGKRGRPPRVKK